MNNIHILIVKIYSEILCFCYCIINCHFVHGNEYHKV
jgi:hypothetical protein